MTKEQAEKFLAEYFDPNKVTLYCAKHMYFGPGGDKKIAPVSGCAKCWEVYFWHDIATCPPDSRLQRLEELTEVVHHMVESVEKGTFDFEPYLHPVIEIEKDGLPD